MKPYKSSIEKRPEVAKLVEREWDGSASLRQIAKDVYGKFNFKVSHQSIKNYIDRKALVILTSAKNDEYLKAKIQKDYDGLLSQLYRIDQETWDIVDTTDDHKTKLNALKEARKQVEFKTKRISRLMEANKNKSYISPLERTRILMDGIKYLERQGHIRIIKSTGSIFNTT